MIQAAPHTPLLAIDTSGPRLQLALLAGARVYVHVEDIAKGHAEILFDRIAVLLADAGLAYADLTGIAVTTGPGSFTGLRIGLSAARGLGLALGIPVIGLPTLLATALPHLGALPVAIVADARRGEAYLAVFDRTGTALVAPTVVPVAKAADHIPPHAREIPHMIPDVAAMARFAATADPVRWPPDPVYVREADAKPQDGARIARIGEGL